MSESEGMKPVYQGAFWAGGTVLTLALQWAAAVLGPWGFFANLLVPLPAAYSQMRCGTAAGVGIVGLSAAILFGSGSSGGAIAYLIQFGIASFVLPLLLRRGYAWGRAVAATLAGVAIAAAVTLGGFALQRGEAIDELVAGYVQAEVDAALSLSEEAELPPEQQAEFASVAKRMGDFLLQAWPALAIVATGAVLLLTVFMLKALSAGYYEVPGLPFRFWSVPDALIWPLILAGFGMVFAEGAPRLAALNLLVILVPVYFLQGMAIVTFYFERKSVPPFFRGLGYLLAVFLNPLPLIVTGIGVFDLWADFRKPRTRKNS